MEMDKEKNISNKNDTYEKLAQDVQILNTLFKDLNYMIKDQGEYLDIIENNISTSKENVIHAHTDLVISNQIINTGFLANISNIKYGTIGAGLGAFILLYNPYIAIGTICLGGIIGFTIGEKLQENLLYQIEENKKE